MGINVFVAVLLLIFLGVVLAVLVAVGLLVRRVTRNLVAGRREWKSLLALLFLILFVAGFFIDLTSGSSATKNNYDQIRIGMTKPEVERLLGPPGDYFSDRTHPYYRYQWRGAPSVSEGTWASHHSSMEWNGDEGGISLYFDQDNQVIVKTFDFGYTRVTWWFWTPIKLEAHTVNTFREIKDAIRAAYTE